MELPEGLIAVSPSRRRGTLETSNDGVKSNSGDNYDLYVPPGVLGYKKTTKTNFPLYPEAKQHEQQQQRQPAEMVADTDAGFSSAEVEIEGPPPGVLGNAPGPDQIGGSSGDGTGSPPDPQAQPVALKLQLHLNKQFHLGLKSLADAERDDLEHGLVAELCATLEIDPSNLELLDVSHPTSRGTMRRTPASSTSSTSIAVGPPPGKLTIQDGVTGSRPDSADVRGFDESNVLSDADISTLKSFACLFNCDDHGHLKAREIVARLRENVSLAHLLRRPLALTPKRTLGHSLNDRFSAMYIAPGTVATFDQIIDFFGADDEKFVRHTTVHPIGRPTCFLKDFEITYAQKAFRGMDASGSTFLTRDVVAEAGGRLSGDLKERIDAFGDEYLTESEFVEILDSVHGEFMSAWSFKQLLEQLERVYLELMSP